MYQQTLNIFFWNKLFNLRFMFRYIVAHGSLIVLNLLFNNESI